VSQRYVKVAAGHYTVPPLHETHRKRYEETISLQMEVYNQLIELLMPDIRRRFYQIFPSRKRVAAQYEGKLRKRAYEIARYILPVATHAYLYHTISALTLLRYHQLSEMYDTPFEQRFVIQKMVDEVIKIDPDFAREIRDPIPLEQTLEYRILDGIHHGEKRGESKQEFIREFDQSLEGRRSKLIDFGPNAEQVLADSARNVLGLPKSRMGDDEAIAIVMSPERNRYLGKTLNLTTLSKLTRAMVHPHYTFRKKLSHTADSQDQRHRMTPASRPILMAHYTGLADYIVPMLIQENPEVLEIYQRAMHQVFQRINDLMDDGVKPEFALYLLPNAFPIRFEESGDLLNLHHKWRTRSCYDSQEEIFFATLDELRQVGEIHPRIAREILAPCYLRMRAGEKPFCPEGDRYCGVPVWKLTIKEYQRIL
jgi:thymidylate synthase ThyX